MRWQRLYNPFVVALLRSPLHGFMSGSTMLLTYTGRKSGKAYTTPVNYLRDGDTLLVVSSREHIWWKNLRGGVPVTARVRGQDMRGVGEAFEGEDAVAEGGLLTVLRRLPAYRRYFGVKVAADGNPEDPEALAQVADSNAVVRIKDLVPSGEALAMKRGWSERGLWLRWVLANSIGEALGLGTTALIGAAIVSSLGEGTSTLATLALAALAVLAGTLVEGTVVGTAQWSVLRGPLPGMRWRTWAVATGAGAFLAWLLGMVPSTVLSLGADSGGASAAPAEPSNAVVLALAFLMGLVLGPVLGFAQWLALRRYVRHAALWMPANALAWAFAMVVIFAGIDPAIGGSFSLLSVAILALTLACAGAVVGAIHGLALVWLLRSPE